MAPRNRAVELEGAGEGQRSGGAGGGRGGRLGAEAGPPVPSLCSLTLTAPRCAEWSGKQRSRVGRAVSWAGESPRLAARRSRLEEAQVSLEFQPRSQAPEPRAPCLAIVVGTLSCELPGAPVKEDRRLSPPNLPHPRHSTAAGPWKPQLHLSLGLEFQNEKQEG